MDSYPDPVMVGKAFVKQYYTQMHKDPAQLHRFYLDQSSFVHGGSDIGSEDPVIGQQVGLSLSPSFPSSLPPSFPPSLLPSLPPSLPPSLSFPPSLPPSLPLLPSLLPSLPPSLIALVQVR